METLKIEETFLSDLSLEVVEVEVVVDVVTGVDFAVFDTPIFVTDTFNWGIDGAAAAAAAAAFIGGGV